MKKIVPIAPASSVSKVNVAKNAISLETLAEQINSEHHAAATSAKDAILRFLTVGDLLNQAKTRVEHGEWLRWLSGNFSGTARQAQKYMRAAGRRGEVEKALRTGTPLAGIEDALAFLAEPNANSTSLLDDYMPWDEWGRIFRDSRTLDDLNAKLVSAGQGPEDGERLIGMIWRNQNQTLIVAKAAHFYVSAGFLERDWGSEVTVDEWVSRVLGLDPDAVREAKALILAGDRGEVPNSDEVIRWKRETLSMLLAKERMPDRRENMQHDFDEWSLVLERWSDDAMIAKRAA